MKHRYLLIKRQGTILLSAPSTLRYTKYRHLPSNTPYPCPTAAPPLSSANIGPCTFVPHRYPSSVCQQPSCASHPTSPSQSRSPRTPLTAFGASFMLGFVNGKQMYADSIFSMSALTFLPAWINNSFTREPKLLLNKDNFNKNSLRIVMHLLFNDDLKKNPSECVGIY